MDVLSIRRGCESLKLAEDNRIMVLSLLLRLERVLQDRSAKQAVRQTPS